MEPSTLHKRVFITLGAVIVFVAVASVILASLNSARSGVSSISSDGSAPTNALYDSAGSDGYAEESSRSYTTQKAAVSDADTSDASDDRQIIKTGSLALVVVDVEGAAGEISTIATGFGGFVMNRDIYDSQAERKSGTVTVRVPNETFDDALTAIKSVADKTTRESVNTQDVTEEYADLEAQLSNKRAVEAQYLQTLARAVSIEDILRVQERLDTTRGEIERLEGQITYLSRQVDMSTISVSLVSRSEVAVFGVVWEPIVEIKQAAYGALEGLVSFIYFLIRFVFALPVIAVWAVTFFGIGLALWKLFRHLKKRLAEPKL